MALPIWTFDDGSFYVVGSREELKELAVEGWNEFDGHSPHRPWIDKVKIKHPKTGLIGTRIEDVGNPWLDAGIVPYSTLKYNSDKSYWDEWFPADFVVESFPGQFRNWFYSLLAMSTMLENKPPFKNLLGHALVRAEDGREMHKSWGNAIWFDDAAEKMGVDVMRWMYALQNPEHNLLFGYSIGNEIRKKLIQLWNSYSFFATYASVDGYDPYKNKVNYIDFSIMDKWIISKLNVFIRDCNSGLEQFRSDIMMRKFDLFLDDLSNWYIRRSRRRFWKSEDDLDKQTAYQVLYECLTTIIKLISPVLPFVTEEIYQNLVKNIDSDEHESIHLCDYPSSDLKKIDIELMKNIDSLRRVVELGRSARNKAKIKIRQPLSELHFHVTDKKVANFILSESKIIEDELNVKKVVQADSEDKLVKFNIKPNLPILGAKYGKNLKTISEAIRKITPDKIISKIRSDKKLDLSIQSKEISIFRDELIFEQESAEKFSSSGDDNHTVGLIIDINEDLKNEGIARDAIRQVQNMRKNANFAVEDRIDIYSDLSGKIGNAIKANIDLFKNEVLALSIFEKKEDVEYSSRIEIDNEILHIGLNKAKSERV